jgi:hypothetical protein
VKRKSDLIKAIYAELRAAAGPQAEARHLIQLAHIVLRAYLDEDQRSDGFGRPGVSREFGTLPVDLAMNDGGWRILEFETSRRVTLDDVEIGELVRLRIIVEQVLGRSWRHQHSPPAQL